MISYEGLEKALKKKGIGKTELSTNLGLSSRTIAKIAKGEKLSKRSIQKIADYLEESPDVIMNKRISQEVLFSWVLCVLFGRRKMVFTNTKIRRKIVLRNIIEMEAVCHEC